MNTQSLTNEEKQKYIQLLTKKRDLLLEKKRSRDESTEREPTKDSKQEHIEEKEEEEYSPYSWEEWKRFGKRNVKNAVNSINPFSIREALNSFGLNIPEINFEGTEPRNKYEEREDALQKVAYETLVDFLTGKGILNAAKTSSKIAKEIPKTSAAIAAAIAKSPESWGKFLASGSAPTIKNLVPALVATDVSEDLKEAGENPYLAALAGILGGATSGAGLSVAENTVKRFKPGGLKPEDKTKYVRNLLDGEFSNPVSDKLKREFLKKLSELAKFNPKKFKDFEEAGIPKTLAEITDLPTLKTWQNKLEKSVGLPDDFTNNRKTIVDRLIMGGEELPDAKELGSKIARKKYKAIENKNDEFTKRFDSTEDVGSTTKISLEPLVNEINVEGHKIYPGDKAGFESTVRGNFKKEIMNWLENQDSRKAATEEFKINKKLFGKQIEELEKLHWYNSLPDKSKKQIKEQLGIQDAILPKEDFLYPLRALFERKKEATALADQAGAWQNPQQNDIAKASHIRNASSIEKRIMNHLFKNDKDRFDKRLEINKDYSNFSKTKELLSDIGKYAQKFDFEKINNFINNDLKTKSGRSTKALIELLKNNPELNSNIKELEKYKWYNELPDNLKKKAQDFLHKELKENKNIFMGISPENSIFIEEVLNSFMDSLGKARANSEFSPRVFNKNWNALPKDTKEILKTYLPHDRASKLEAVAKSLGHEADVKSMSNTSHSAHHLEETVMVENAKDIASKVVKGKFAEAAGKTAIFIAEKMAKAVGSRKFVDQKFLSTLEAFHNVKTKKDLENALYKLEKLKGKAGVPDDLVEFAKASLRPSLKTFVPLFRDLEQREGNGDSE